jgi:hypothetical protein
MTPVERARFWVQEHCNGVRDSFLPRKDDVTDDYWDWLRWRLTQVPAPACTRPCAPAGSCLGRRAPGGRRRARRAATLDARAPACSSARCAAAPWPAPPLPPPNPRPSGPGPPPPGALQRFFSSCLQNFATQSLLTAVGIGAKKAVAASAAINWMLKDGMGRIVRMTVATQCGESFDSDLKVGAAQRSLCGGGGARSPADRQWVAGAPTRPALRAATNAWSMPMSRPGSSWLALPVQPPPARRPPSAPTTPFPPPHINTPPPPPPPPCPLCPRSASDSPRAACSPSA